MAYKLHYSDYPGTDTGPPDPGRWVGPTGPMGPPGPQGADGPAGAAFGVNVLDYGADPTGVADSSAAINAAAAVVGPNGRHKTVYLPTGTYHVRHQINLTASQGMMGDTRGSSIITVSDDFDPAATAVIYCTASSYDAGPVLRDFGITFAQPLTQGVRANFKTLAAGGTSSAGGTGVAYPWAIASGSNSFRIQIIRVRIGGAWDGITTNGFNTVFWLDDVEMGALDCGVNLGDGPGVQDFCHIKSYHFWAFELGTTADAIWNVFNDGQNISLRVGRCDGLSVIDFGSFCGRVVFTGGGGGATNCQIVNCGLDTDSAGIEVGGAGVNSLVINNVYSTSGTARIRPVISIAGLARVRISNWYSHSSSNYPDILVSDDNADVSLTNFYSLFYTTTVNWAQVVRGKLRLADGYLFPGGSRTVPAIAETTNGILSVDNVQIDGGTTGGGVVLSMVTVSSSSIIGRIAFAVGSAWTVSLPAGISSVSYGDATFRGSVLASGLVSAATTLQTGSTAGSGANVALYSATGQQRSLIYFTGTNIAWGATVSGAGNDYTLGRWNDAGVLIGTAIGIGRLSGVISLPALQASASYASDAAASAGGIPVGGLYRNGSAVMVRVA